VKAGITMIGAVVGALALTGSAAAFSITFSTPKLDAKTGNVTVTAFSACDAGAVTYTADALLSQHRDRNGDWRRQDEQFAQVPCGSTVTLTFTGFHAGPALIDAGGFEFFPDGSYTPTHSLVTQQIILR